LIWRANEDTYISRDFQFLPETIFIAQELVFSSGDTLLQNQIMMSAGTKEVNSSASASSEVSEIMPPATTTASSSNPSKLEDMMLERLTAVDNIRHLLRKELEQDNLLIAEFMEKIVELESVINSKDNEIKLLNEKALESKEMIGQVESLTVQKDTLTATVDEMTQKNKAYEKEFKALSATIDGLVDRTVELETENQIVTSTNTTLDKNMAPLQARNDKLVEMVTTLTTSLKEAKYSLEKEMEQTVRLEKDKLDLQVRVAKNNEDHEKEIEKWQQRLDESSHCKAQLKKEMDDLRKALCEEQLANTQLSALRANMASAEQTISRITKERNRLSEELKETNKNNERLEKKMSLATSSSDPTGALRKELESMRKQLCKEQQNNAQLISLKARLEETERSLAKLMDEKLKLREELGETKNMMSFDIQESKSRSSEMIEWLGEKKSMQRRLRDSEKALVLLAQEKDAIEVKLKEATITSTMSPNKEEKLASELVKLQTQFIKEKKEMMTRQQKLEGMLIQALASDQAVRKKLSDVQASVLISPGLSKKAKKTPAVSE
jgi:chromosome segregation ATPase